MNGNNTTGTIIHSPSCRFVSPVMLQPGCPSAPRPRDYAPPKDLFDRPLPKELQNVWGTERSDRAVQCIETGMVYPSVIAAAQATGTTRQTVTRHCNATKRNGNVRWRWASDES